MERDQHLLHEPDESFAVAAAERRSDRPATAKTVTVLDLFNAQVADTPLLPAVLSAGRALSYRELDRRAQRLALALRALGVGHDRVVAISLERSPAILVAILAVLKAGGAYVALDPSYPQPRLDTILDDARPLVLVTDAQGHARYSDYRGKVVEVDPNDGRIVDDRRPLASASPAMPPAGDWLAYLVYTSGSTGTPKGVAVEHRPLLNLIEWQLRQSRVGRGARTLQFTSLAFDVSFQEIFATWCSGGALVLVDERTRRDAEALRRLIEETGVARLFLPYVALQGLAVAAAVRGRVPEALTEIIVAGETLRITSQIAALFSRLPGCTLFNQYGPAETAVIVTSFALAGDPSGWAALPPIGRPIDNVGVMILDEDRKPAPIGVAGEIYIGGAALARGYLNSPELTAEKFVTARFDDAAGDERLYRTGDLGRLLADGSIEFLGRLDRQVKLRGYRIEPGEIEVALAAHPQVRQAVVKLYEPAIGDKRLVAYVQAPPGARPTEPELRRFLAARLPRFMVPSLFVFVEAVPLTPSGKIDPARLPEPQPGGTEPGTSADDGLEPTLAAIWARVLRLPTVGPTDNFFEIGGDSLLALQLAIAIEEALERTVPLGTIFVAPTVTELAKALGGGRPPAAGFSLVPLQTAGTAPPIFFVHWLPRDLVRALGRDRPIYGLAYGLAAQTAHRPAEPPDRLERMAAQYIEEMRTVQPRGPYTLVGWSAGGLVAFEMAQQLRAAGEAVGFLGLIDTIVLSRHVGEPFVRFPLRRQIAELLRLPWVEIRLWLAARCRKWARRKTTAALEPLDRLLRQGLWNESLWNTYVPRLYAGELTLFAARTPWSVRYPYPTAAPDWRELTGGRVEIHEVPGRHMTMVMNPNVRALAAKLLDCLGRHDEPAA